MPAQVNAYMPPHGCTWGRYLELLVQAHGSAATLTDLLIQRASGSVTLPEDPQSIERGLRRLATRGHAPGGQYGRWLLRFFGVPPTIARTARWMGQYHSRFSDLPVSLCASQLGFWDRPPVSDSRVAAWIHLGLAAVAMRQGMRDTALQRLRLGEARAQQDPAARAEAALLAARLASDRGEQDATRRHLQHAAESVRDMDSAELSAPYTARLLDQQAYAVLHPPVGAPDLEAGRTLYAAIPDASDQPFVAFRRAHGLAYCAWRMGDRDQARALAQQAGSHAGDGGLIRFRLMAIKLLAHIEEGEARRNLRARAAKLAATLEHENI
ncbi:MAG: hypothetical protein ACPG77_02205 [Nannocystaceae bacterium]